MTEELFRIRHKGFINCLMEKRIILQVQAIGGYISKDFKKFKEKERTRTVYEQAWIHKDETALSARNFGTRKIHFTLIKDSDDIEQRPYKRQVNHLSQNTSISKKICPSTQCSEDRHEED
ncbi:hypothetical protein RIR_jg10319.t1 [Rhizophagus irregularis DAOM 181602=DAOM 197198]|nr:hypothetical protein RIR_jg10319.t1 [Rhizophagus irregularis DAOM 181602=DAOM 197198]